jgi:hypothetical protein
VTLTASRWLRIAFKYTTLDSSGNDALWAW